jgi:hypothetical protein
MNKPQSMAITVHSSATVASGVTAVNGGVTPINWVAFNDAAPLNSLYKYFEIVGCRIRVSLASTVAATDSFLAGAVAFYPINYFVEGFPSTAPTQLTSVNELPGSVFIQYGANNYGRWFNPNIKHQFSCSDAFGPSNRAAGSIIWFVDDLGISETAAIVDIELNLRFTQREYTANYPTYQSSKTQLQVQPMSTEVIQEIDFYKAPELCRKCKCG